MSPPVRGARLAEHVPWRGAQAGFATRNSFYRRRTPRTPLFGATGPGSDYKDPRIDLADLRHWFLGDVVPPSAAKAHANFSQAAAPTARGAPSPFGAVARLQSEARSGAAGAVAAASSPVRRFVQPTMSDEELRATVREHASNRLEATESRFFVFLNPGQAAAKGLRFQKRRTLSMLTGLSADANADDELADINTGLSENDDAAAAIHNLSERFLALEQSSRTAERNQQRGMLLQQTQLDRVESALASLQAQILDRLPAQSSGHERKLRPLGTVQGIGSSVVPFRPATPLSPI